MEYLGTIYKGSQSDIIFPVPFIELSDGATVDFYTDGEGGFSRTKDEIKIDNYMLKTTASADELNALNDGVLNYTINTCMGKSEGDTGLYLSEPTSYVEKQYLTADNVKTINGESIVGQGDIEIQGGGSEDYIWEWGNLKTGDTTFTNEQITEIENAYNDGKNIILDLIGEKIYPNSFSLSKDGNDVVIVMQFLYNGNNCYKWEYYNYVDNDFSGQTLELTKFIAEENNANIKCKSITTQGHGNLDTAISDLQKQIDNSETSKLQEEISALTKQITLEREDRVKNDEILQSNINFNLEAINRVALQTNDNTDNIIILESSATTLSIDLTALSGSVVKNYYTKTEVDGKIPTKTSQLTNDSGYLTSVPDGYAKTADIEKTYLKITDASATYQPKGNYLTEHQSLEEYYTKTQCDKQYETKGYSYSKSESDTNYASKTDTYTKEEIDSKIGALNNILETI